MHYETALRAMTPEIYERMVVAVETGRWPDGQKLTEAQLENSMQLVMMYQKHFLDQDEHFSINKKGELVFKSKRDLKEELRAKALLDSPPIATFSSEPKK
ncbi:MAG: hypothetical protein HLUCCO02_03175 [Idiomarinaceae bacterium HL-53]|nr:MAG: hypothetical protein HLUCCO02_03175 [Idiomarinaceae bacterium HL-53]CUS49022.1 hypothetical protein Ga0003345_2004 [Idiomarinaceae bacterium HL-53]